MLHHALQFACAIALAPALAADVLVLAADGSGDFTSPSTAIAAAADGDTILVRPGDYSDFFFGAKSLTIVAETPGTARFVGAAVSSLAPGQRAVLSGLLFVGPSFDISSYHVLDVRDCAGAVRVEDCSFTGAPGSYSTTAGMGHSAVYVENSHDVALANCAILGGPGLDFVDAFGLYEPCPPSSPVWYTGGPAVELIGASVALHDCTLTGGRGGEAGLSCGYSGPGGPGLRALASTAFLSGCDVVGGTGGFAPPCACGGDGGTTHVLDATLVDALDTTFTVGAPAPGSAGGAAGPPPTLTGGAVIATLPGPARTLVAPGALTAGTALHVDVLGRDGDAVFLAAAASPGSFDVAGLTGPLLLVPPFAVSGAPLGTIGASGQVSASFPTPLLPVGAEHASVFLQALSVDVGGAFVLTGARSVSLFTSAILL